MNQHLFCGLLMDMESQNHAETQAKGTYKESKVTFIL